MTNKTDSPSAEILVQQLWDACVQAVLEDRTEEFYGETGTHRDYLIRIAKRTGGRGPLFWNLHPEACIQDPESDDGLVRRIAEYSAQEALWLREAGLEETAREWLYRTQDAIAARQGA